jgi:hypothetical protein
MLSYIRETVTKGAQIDQQQILVHHGPGGRSQPETRPVGEEHGFQVANERQSLRSIGGNRDHRVRDVNRDDGNRVYGFLICRRHGCYKCRFRC